MRPQKPSSQMRTTCIEYPTNLEMDDGGYAASRYNSRCTSRSDNLNDTHVCRQSTVTLDHSRPWRIAIGDKSCLPRPVCNSAQHVVAHRRF